MKIVTRQVFQAFDGTEFGTSELCKAWESEHIENLLVGLTLEEVKAAVQREPQAIGLSDAIEDLGNRIAKLRRKTPGGLRVVRKSKVETPPATTPAEPPQGTDPAPAPDPHPAESLAAAEPPFTSTLMAG